MSLGGFIQFAYRFGIMSFQLFAGAFRQIADFTLVQ